MEPIEGTSKETSVGDAWKIDETDVGLQADWRLVSCSRSSDGIKLGCLEEE